MSVADDVAEVARVPAIALEDERAHGVGGAGADNCAAADGEEAREVVGVGAEGEGREEEKVRADAGPGFGDAAERLESREVAGIIDQSLELVGEDIDGLESHGRGSRWRSDDTAGWAGLDCRIAYQVEWTRARSSQLLPGGSSAPG